MMSESNPSPSSAQIEGKADSLSDQLRTGLELRVLELVITSYKNMQADKRYGPGWRENKFTAVLRGYIKRNCQKFSRITKRQWHVEREHPLDNKDILSGEGNADEAPRIDIVVLTWTTEYEEIKFPFECKLIAESNTTLIRLYIQKGLRERYLTEKDYSEGTHWGGMIGYVLTGNHHKIILKLNEQIDKQLKDSKAHLEIRQPVAEFEAIYHSYHPYQGTSESLIITHLFLSFFEE